MSTRQVRRTGLSRLVLPAICCLLSAYFVHHSLSGRFGWHAQQELHEREIELQYRLAALEIEKDRIASRVVLLKQGEIERDMLDEQVRYNLNLLEPDEVVLMRK